MMNKNTRWTNGAIVAVAILCLAASLGAQQPPPNRGSGGPGPGFGGPGIGFVGFEIGFGRKVISDHPFTAGFTNTTAQTLANGTTIQHQSSGTLARDKSGRTYEQMTLAAIGPWAASGNPPQVIYISDPVAGLSYVLDPGKMTGRQFTLHVPSGNPPANRPPRPPPSGEQVTPLSLPIFSLNGVNFDGTGEQRTIPANQIGNSNPIQTAFSRWYSSALQIVGKTERSDPRFGTTTFVLTSLQSGDPSADLFSVSGYAITAAPPGPRGQGPRGGGPPPGP
jgi:hypothetical protein